VSWSGCGTSYENLSAVSAQAVNGDVAIGAVICSVQLLVVLRGLLIMKWSEHRGLSCGMSTCACVVSTLSQGVAGAQSCNLPAIWVRK
jgi:hypothetical protein